MFQHREQSVRLHHGFTCGTNKSTTPSCSYRAEKKLNLLVKAVAAASAFSIIAFPMTYVLAGSLTVFAVANEYCKKRELGMSKDAAVRHAMNYVMSNSMFDPDYNLPNFSKLVSREIYEKCPQFLNK